LDYNILQSTPVKQTDSASASVVSDEDIKSSINFIDGEIETLMSGNLQGLNTLSVTQSELDKLGDRYSEYFAEKSRMLLDSRMVLGRKGYEILLPLFYSDIDTQNNKLFIMENETAVRELINNIKLFKGYSLILDTISKLMSFDFKMGEFGVAGKKEVEKEIEIDGKAIGEFTKEELESGEFFIDKNNTPLSLHAFLEQRHSTMLSSVISEIEESNTPDVAQRKIIQNIEDNYSTKKSVDTWTVPLHSIYRIFKETIYDNIVEELNSNSIVKQQALNEMVESLRKIQPDASVNTVMSYLKTGYYWFYTAITHFMGQTSLLIYEKGVDKDVKMNLTYGLSQILPVIQSLVDNYVRTDPTARAIAIEYLESNRVVKYPTNYSEGRLNELKADIKAEWLDNARHYQNSDARKFAKQMQGSQNYGTGLGKTLASFLTSTMMLKEGTAKRPMYVVLNSTFPKMVNEAKKVFTEAKLKRCLFLNSQNIGEARKLIEKSKIDFVIISKSALEHNFKLRDNTVESIFGYDKVKGHIKIGVNYSQCNMQDWVESPPTFNENAMYYFEDIGVDAMILDEAHEYKNATSAKGTVKGLNNTDSNNALITLFFAEYIKGIKREDMRGVIGATATQLTNSPSEILTNLILTTDRKAFGAIQSKADFESAFYDIGEDLALKTDGITWEMKKKLIGVKNIDLLHEIGYDAAVFRDAESEQAKASERGVIISTKPPSNEFRVVSKITAEAEDTYTLMSELQRKLSSLERGTRNDPTLENMIFREFSMFGFISKVKNLSISNKLAYGYTELIIDASKKGEVFNAIKNIKFKVKEGVIAKVRGTKALKIKRVNTTLADYENTQYYKLRQQVAPETIIPLFEEVRGRGYLNLPITDYATIIKFIKALQKKKLIGDIIYDLDNYPKIVSMLDNMGKKIMENPKAKQIVYSTALMTHSIIENAIKQRFGTSVKVWIFNPSHIKKDTDKFKVQEEFNSYNDFAVMIFGTMGEVGVDFNKYVNAVHLLDVGNTPKNREQAKGRAVRQGNTLKVDVFNYSASGTFDFFLEELVNDKSNWIEAVNTKDSKTSFSVDTIEQIAVKAERKYKHLDISVEDKIKLYIKEVGEENRRMQKRVENTLTYSMIQQLKRTKEKIDIATGNTGKVTEGGSHPSDIFYPQGKVGDNYIILNDFDLKFLNNAKPQNIIAYMEKLLMDEYKSSFKRYAIDAFRREFNRVENERGNKKALRTLRSIAPTMEGVIDIAKEKVASKIREYDNYKNNGSAILKKMADELMQRIRGLDGTILTDFEKATKGIILHNEELYYIWGVKDTYFAFREQTYNNRLFLHLIKDGVGVRAKYNQESGRFEYQKEKSWLDDEEEDFSTFEIVGITQDIYSLGKDFQDLAKNGGI
jgi:hypothetical protein